MDEPDYEHLSSPRLSLQTPIMSTSPKCDTQSPLQALQHAHSLLRDRNLDDDEAYRLMVLRFAETETNIDQHMLQTATELGLCVQPLPFRHFDQEAEEIADENMAAGSIIVSRRTSVAPSKSELQPIHSELHTSYLVAQQSESVGTISDSSIESTQRPKSPSVTATSMTSVPSMKSSASQKPSSSRFKDGIRRLSIMRSGRKKIHNGATSSMSDSARRHSRQSYANSSRDISPSSFSADGTTMSAPRGTNKSHSGSISARSRHANISLSSLDAGASVPQSGSPREPSPAGEYQNDLANMTLYDTAAHDRTHTNTVLCKLRSSQLQEQMRFICFRASQTRLMRAKHGQIRQDILTDRRQTHETIETRHADALCATGKRHLYAEEDLRKQLETDRLACETRLKHMQAYVNSASSGASGQSLHGMPARHVTDNDFKKLEQQYHLRNTIDETNQGRINTLRDRQTKQVERELDRQEQDFERLRAEFDRKMEMAEGKRKEEEKKLDHVFTKRRDRLSHRWKVTEAIERRKLELDLGLPFAPLTPISWGPDDADVEEQEREVQRLLKEKKIAIDPDSGVMMMEESDDDEEDRFTLEQLNRVDDGGLATLTGELTIADLSASESGTSDQAKRDYGTNTGDSIDTATEKLNDKVETPLYLDESSALSPREAIFPDSQQFRAHTYTAPKRSSRRKSTFYSARKTPN